MVVIFDFYHKNCFGNLIHTNTKVSNIEIVADAMLQYMYRIYIEKAVLDIWKFLSKL